RLDVDGTESQKRDEEINGPRGEVAEDARHGPRRAALAEHVDEEHDGAPADGPEEEERDRKSQDALCEASLKRQRPGDGSQKRKDEQQGPLPGPLPSASGHEDRGQGG